MLFDHVLDRRDGLRPAEAAKRRVRRQIGPADAAREFAVRKPVGILGVQERALHDGQR